MVATGAGSSAAAAGAAGDVLLGQMLAAERIEEAAGWVDRLLDAAVVEECGERRRVATKLKLLDALKRAADKAEAALRRRQQTLALDLVPGLSDQLGRARQGEFPLSYSQQQMLALQHMQPGSAAYNVARAVRVPAPLQLNVRALKSAVNALLNRHEGLRMLFELDPITGEAFQRLAQDGTNALTERVFRVTIWNRAADKYRDDHALGEFVASSMAAAPFDLANELPIRVVAISTGEPAGVPVGCPVDSSWTLVTVIHHIATDSVSSAVIWRDLMKFYMSCASSAAIGERALCPMKPGPVVQYRDFAAWQRERVDFGLLDASIRYWTARLVSSGEVQTLSLPFEKQSQKCNSRGDMVSFQVPDEALDRMTTLCRSCGCTLFMGLLAVFYELLARLAGKAQPDITIGSPVSVRDREELQEVVGYFVNTLPLRIQPSTSNGQVNSFVELLALVRGVVLGAFAHMDVPFHAILENLRRSGSSASSSAGQFQVMFALETSDPNVCDSGSVVGSEVSLSRSVAKFDLMLTMRTRNSDTQHITLEGEMEFPVSKFSREAVDRFARYYCELLIQLTQDPNKPLNRISMIPIDERRLVVNNWGAPSPKDECELNSSSPFIDECLLAQVRKTPDRWALHFECDSWSYSTLWHESGRVHRALIQLKSKEQLRVGIFEPRGLENVASIIGVMRSSAVFVPLDASFPSERLRYMIADSELHAVVTQRSHHSRLRQLLTSSVRVLVYEDLPLLDDNFSDCRRREAHADSPAYILYTSGSTGSPKGVVISHSNLLTTLWWTVGAYAVSPQDVFLQSTSTTLDGSLTQLLSPLLAGGSAVITRDRGLHDLDYIRSLLKAPPPRAITYCVFVPSYLSTLLDHAADQRCFPRTLKHVVIVGEAFPMELARRFYHIHNDNYSCLVNEYGPTEASVTSTFLRLPSSDSSAIVDTVPIGRPIWGRRVLVLDECGRLVPPNVRGELLIGGPGVSVDGYWRRPELTKSAFDHPNIVELLRPLVDEPETRWYHTGDVVRWLPDGNLEFVGRVDAQVKLHGQRVELNEVRNVLLGHPKIVDAEVRVVTPGIDKRVRGPRLVAFVILRESRDGDGVDELVLFLRSRLPLHMVPQDIHTVHEWPRTPNGKLDIRALLKQTETEGFNRRVPAQRTPVDRSLTVRVTRDLLISIWRQVLNLRSDEPWRSKSFFDLGGDSLAAIRAISIARARGLVLTLDEFFTSPSVDDMAERISTSTDLATLTARPLVPLNSPPSSSQSITLFLIHCADGTVWKLRELASLLPFRVVGVQATINDPADGVDSIEALATKYWSEIHALQPTGPYALGGYSFGCRVAYAVGRLAAQAGHSLHPLTLIDGAPYYVDDHDNEASSTSDVEAYITETFGGQRPTGAETKFFQQLADQFRSHCAMDAAYNPVSSPVVSIDPPLAASVYKTTAWEVDTTTLRDGGVEIETMTIPEATHLTMLRRPHVNKLAHAILGRLQSVDG